MAIDSVELKKSQFALHFHNSSRLQSVVFGCWVVTPQLIQLRKIEASLKAIEKWDGRMPKITSGAVPFLDMNALEDR